MPSISFLTALAAGLLSFLSPCILPLVPVYLANIAGASVLTPDLPDRRRILLHTISFIVGFSLVFVTLGASLGLLGAALPQAVLEKVGGALLITFGVFLIAAAKVPWLNYEKRLDFARAKGTGYLRSLLIGVIFSLGWIPCVGPILGGILTLAASSQTVWQGVYLLLAYCLGLGLPFIAVGLALGAASRYIRWLSRHAFVTSIVAAVLLITIGILMLTGYLEYLSGLMPGGYQYGW
ncbi:MAG: cytochrome c biogenesis protein CcdA [Dehalococcoidia bacterium]|nr:cytochrome c biogenesis protein CcdA [Dehalococcoidia bacterium]MDH4291704.1 cytochrome c biogenesis protein CcdA [Dehalococcoidia bacterium]